MYESVGAWEFLCIGIGCPVRGEVAGICLKYYCECEAFTVIRQELVAREFGSAESTKMREYFVYFPISVLQVWGKRPAT